MKVYVTFADASSLTPEQVKCSFTPTSFQLEISNHQGKNYEMLFKRLAKDIEPAESYYKLRKGEFITK